MRGWQATGTILTATLTLLATNIAGCPAGGVEDPIPDGDPIVQRPLPQPDPDPQPQPDPEPQPQPTPKPVAPMLFLTNISTQSVQSFTSPAALTGDVPPTGIVTGALTQLSAPYDVAVTVDGLVIVSNHNGNSLNFYLNGETLNGNAEPRRSIAGPATGLQSPRNIVWDRNTDALLVSDVNAASPIKLFASVSNNATAGDVAPLHSIRSADITVAAGISFTAAGSLFVANANTDANLASIAVFDNALNLNGNVPANRVIKSTAFGAGAPFDLQVAADDTLYVVTLDSRVLVFRNASTLNGQVQPDSTLTVTGASLRSIAVDKAGVGYLTNQSAQPGVLVFDSIATRTGTLPPDRTIAGTQAQISSPWGSFLWE